MPNYILNRNQQDSRSGSNNELHDITPGKCIRLPAPQNQLPVGYHANCHDAIASAKRQYPQYQYSIDGCYYCCPECHRE